MRRLCAPRAVATPLRDASDARTCDRLLRAAVVHVGTAEAGGGPSPPQVRVSNLSEDVKDSDLRELFRRFGAIQRIYLAKDRDTRASRGFAFINFFDRGDAQRAIDKLDGHGYDHLILSVGWANPAAAAPQQSAPGMSAEAFPSLGGGPGGGGGGPGLYSARGGMARSDEKRFDQHVFNPALDR